MLTLTDYTLEFGYTYGDEKVVMNVQATSMSAAEKLGDSIAENMPTERVYFDKNDCDIDSNWCCNVTENKE